jgi:hypothetical protein
MMISGATFGCGSFRRLNRRASVSDSEATNPTASSTNTAAIPFESILPRKLGSLGNTGGCVVKVSRGSGTAFFASCARTASSSARAPASCTSSCASPC